MAEESQRDGHQGVAPALAGISMLTPSNRDAGGVRPCVRGGTRSVCVCLCVSLCVSLSFNMDNCCMQVGMTTTGALED